MKKILLLDRAEIQKAVQLYVEEKGFRVKEIILDIRKLNPDHGDLEVEAKIEIEER